MVIIWKFRIIVLVSNRIEYWSNYSIRFEILNIRTALLTINHAVIAPLKSWPNGAIEIWLLLYKAVN